MASYFTELRVQGKVKLHTTDKMEEIILESPELLEPGLGNALETEPEASAHPPQE